MVYSGYVEILTDATRRRFVARDSATEFVCVAEASPDGSKRTIVGTDPLFLFAALCDECGETHEFSCCPDCGAWISQGFGVGIGPGYGAYWCCEDFCGWFQKECLADDEA